MFFYLPPPSDYSEPEHKSAPWRLHPVMSACAFQNYVLIVSECYHFSK